MKKITVEFEIDEKQERDLKKSLARWKQVEKTDGSRPFADWTLEKVFQSIMYIGSKQIIDKQLEEEKKNWAHTAAAMEAEDEIITDFLKIELGESIETMNFRFIADTVRKKYNVSDNRIKRILETKFNMYLANDPEFRTCDCAICGKETRRIQMQFTRDCHGIPYRLACMDCYEEAMTKGYDGQYYTDEDEYIDYDY